MKNVIKILFWKPLILVCFAGLLSITATLIMYETIEKAGGFKLADRISERLL